MKLYDYFRSTAAFRVRIACQLKQIEVDLTTIHLVNNGGEQHSAEYKSVNPQGLVPTLEDENFHLGQSLAILEYLEEKYPEQTPLLPKDIQARAYVRQIMQLVACDIHPLNNLRVLNFLKQELNISDEDKTRWYHHWISEGFSALENLLQQHQRFGSCCFGNTPTVADCCLIPQVFNAHRFACPMDAFPIINTINEHCLALPAFKLAHPDNYTQA